MKLSTNLKRILGGTALVAALALGVSAILPDAVSAQGGPGGFKGGDKAGMRGDFSGIRGEFGGDDTYLADALGITSDELQAANEAAEAAALQQAVDEGLITQAQADAIQERGGRFDGRLLGRFGLGDNTIDREALLADALGISTDDLQAAHETANDARIAQAVADGSLTQEQADEMSAMRNLNSYLDESGLQDSIRNLREKAIQGAVDAGIITQEQADSILEGQNGFGMRDFGGRGGHEMPGFGGRGGMRGGHGMRGGPGMRGFDGQGFTPGGSIEVAPTAFSL